MYTYNTLIADLQAITSDNDTDFVAEMPLIVKRAESRIMRDLDFELFEQIDNTVSTTSGARAVSKPANTVMVSTLWYRDADGVNHLVEERGYAYCLDYAPDETDDTGAPKYYAEFEDTLYLSPTPAAVLPLRMKVIRRPDGLAPANQNSWLATHMGDLLLQVALIESWQFLKNEAKMNEAATMYASLLPTAKAEVMKLARRTYSSLGMSGAPQQRGEG
jgi:hypothetical protein